LVRVEKEYDWAHGVSNMKVVDHYERLCPFLELMVNGTCRVEPEYAFRHDGSCDRADDL
jgi:hypothetical protein